MFVCAGESEQFDFATPIGIGLIDAAINLTKICLDRKPEHLIFVGTAGSYGNKNIFDIVESAVSCNLENGFLEGKTYTPIANKVNLADELESSNVSRETIINSSSYITVDRASSEQFLLNGIELENMEFYAVLKVAEKFGIAAHGIFIVTNYCDASAHNDFISNHSEAKKRLTKYVGDRYE